MDGRAADEKENKAADQGPDQIFHIFAFSCTPSPFRRITPERIGKPEESGGKKEGVRGQGSGFGRREEGFRVQETGDRIQESE